MFWERFKNECEKIGKKPNPVAKELGISSGTVTGWKNGSTPQTHALDKLANYFGCTTDYLLGLSDSRNSEESINPFGSLSEQEQTLIKLFRETSEEGRLEMISAFMSIRNRENGIHTIYRAASSSEHEEPRIEQRTATDMGKLKNASTVTSEEDL